MKRVVIVQETLPQYRVALLEEVRRQAAVTGIAVEVVHGLAPGDRGNRLSTGDLPGAIRVRNRYLTMPWSSLALVWQPALCRCLRADLVVVEQANRLLLNYVLLVAQRLGGPRVAFWGHGRNMQSSSRTVAERVKRRVLRMPGWWFAYTEGVAAYLRSAGYPSDRVTVIGNTIDVEGLQHAVEQERARGAVVKQARCIYVGGLYAHKRLEFLFTAADRLAACTPGFELLIAGDGEERRRTEIFAAARPWATYLGPVKGARRARLLAEARLLLVPGLVGLVILDGFAAGVPVVTTSDAQHSPEIEYLRDGVNGVVLPPGATPAAYAAAVHELLVDDVRWASLREGCLRSAAGHAVADAAGRFAAGMRAALPEREDVTRAGVVLFDPDPVNPFGRELGRVLGRSGGVTLYCSRAASWAPESVDAAPVLASSVESDGYGRSIALRAMGPLRAVFRARRQSRPLVVVWTRHSWEALVFAVAGMLGMRLAVIDHNPAKERAKTGLAGLTESLLRRVAPVVVVLADELVDEAQRGGPAVVVGGHPSYLGWRERFFDHVTVPDPAHRRTRLLFLGAVRPDKGASEIAAVIAGLRRHRVTLVLAGRGDLPAGSAEIIAAAGSEVEHVSAGDFLDDAALGRLLHGIDLLIAPYPGASQSGSAVLALTCDIPALGYRAGGLAALLRDGSMTAPSPAELSERIDAFLDDPWPTWRRTATELDEIAASGWLRVLDVLREDASRHRSTIWLRR